MSKKLNSTQIKNELKGNSSFFQKKTEVKQSQEIFSQNERTEMRSEMRTLELPQKRLTRRYSFEFYDDQINRIKQMKYEATFSGRSISMSEIVRLALDSYLQTQDK
ncbi:MAG: hypothetical protein Phog2KO_22040 [Phototrophicaceae bacterium]